MNEIQRLQQLAGINKFSNYKKIWEECLNEAENGDWIDHFDNSVPKLHQTYFKKVNSYAKKIFENKTGFSYDILNEIKINNPFKNRYKFTTKVKLGDMVFFKDSVIEDGEYDNFPLEDLLTDKWSNKPQEWINKMVDKGYLQRF